MDMQIRRPSSHAQTVPESGNEEPKQACSICSGTLVFDETGTAVFCDECWDRKCPEIGGD